MSDANVASQAYVPFRQGLFRFEEGVGELLGGRCRHCRTWYFPSRRVCAKCLSQKIEVLPLSKQGTVYTYTTIYQSTPEFQVPYILVYVDLPEGVRVLAQLTQCSPEAVRIGMPVEVVFEEVGRDQEGRAIIGYRFRPVGPWVRES